jgi:carbonic anhydrase
VTISPTSLTLRHLRDQGYTAEVVEHWNSFVGRRFDLFGIIDVLALRDGETLAVQTTSAANVPHRVDKIADSPYIAAIRAAGWTVRVHGWAKVRGRWVLKRDVDVS